MAALDDTAFAHRVRSVLQGEPTQRGAGPGPGHPPLERWALTPFDSVQRLRRLLMGRKHFRPISMALFDLAPKESPEALFGREKDLSELVRFVRAKRWVVVLGPRMVGKTSLVKALRHHIGRPGAYVNLWGVRSVQGLVEGLIAGFNESASLRARLARSFRRIDGISLGPGGLSLSAPRPPLKTAWELLDLLGSEAGDCLVVLDEVQELQPASGQLQRLLASLFNTHPNVCFVFTGSLVGLARTLLEPSAGSPLYGRSPVPLTLGPFDRATAAGFLLQGAKEAGVAVPPSDLAAALDGPLDGTPGWLTLFGNHMAVRRMPPARALRETIREGRKVAESEIAHFLENRDPEIYWPALKAMAIRSAWGTVREYIGAATHRPTNDATVRRVIRGLEASFIARKADGVYEIVDPMVRDFVAAASSPPVRSRRRDHFATYPPRHKNSSF